MKTFVLSVAIAATTFSACSNNNSSKETANKSNDSGATTTQVNNTANNQSSSVDEALNAYLQIKNALANDDAKEAATGGSAFVQAIEKMDKSSLKPDQKEAADDAKEMAEHISKSEGKIAHQREHFDMLSQDMYDMVKATGSNKTLYKDFCPMYNNKKGASWLSETKEIKNPYMGKEMQTCGEVKEEIKK